MSINKSKLLEYSLIIIIILCIIIFNNVIVFNAKAREIFFFNFNENDTPNNSPSTDDEANGFNRADHNNFINLEEFYNKLDTLFLISNYITNKDLKLFIQNINSNLFYFKLYANLYFNINYNFEISDLYIDKINNFVLLYNILNLNFKYLLSPSFVINFSIAISSSQNNKTLESDNSITKIFNAINITEYHNYFNNNCVYYSLFLTNIIDLNRQIQYGFIFQESFIDELNDNGAINLLEPLTNSNLCDYIFFINGTRIINIVKNIDYIFNFTSYCHIIYYKHSQQLLDMIAFNNLFINKYQAYAETNIDNILKYQILNTYIIKFNFMLGANLSVISYSNMINNFNNFSKNFIYNFFIFSGINIEYNDRRTLSDYSGFNINIITKYDIKNKNISINYRCIFNF